MWSGQDEAERNPGYRLAPEGSPTIDGRAEDGIFQKVRDRTNVEWFDLSEGLFPRVDKRHFLDRAA
jgi:hypothetical protein